MNISPTRRDLGLIFLALLLAYCYVLPRWADWSQNSRLDLVRALAEQGTTRIDAYVANTGDYAEFEGHTYTDKAPGPAFVGLPLYAAALPLIDHPAITSRLERLAGGAALSGTLNPQGSGLRADKVRQFVAQYLLTAATVALPAAALGALLYTILAQLGFARGLRLLVTLGYGLATPAAAYAGNFYSHQFVAALLFGAFALLLPTTDDRRPTTDRAEDGGWRMEDGSLAISEKRSSIFHPRSSSGIGWARALLVGLLSGFVLISEYPAAIIVAALGIYALVRLPLRQVAIAVVGGALPLALMLVYDLRSFGTFIPVGYAHSALWQNQHHSGFLSITYPHLDAIWGLTGGTFRGLFVRAPWLLLALPGFVLWWRGGQRRGAWWVALVASAGLTLFYAASVMWWGGFGAGPRYIVPMLPFLALAAAYGLHLLWERRAGRVAAVTLVALSAGLTWVEALARQSFPPDSIAQPWRDYTMPAWLAGDIARNLGMVLGLRGSWSLIPLIAALALLLGLLVLPARTENRRCLSEKGEFEGAAPQESPFSSV